MKIAKWELSNYGPFKGEHVLDLRKVDADVFAVTARFEDDEERSNWGGKSFLVHSLALALFDAYPSKLADDWISDGETNGYVGVLFDDGKQANRVRIREKSTQLAFIVGSGTGPATGKHAQAALEEALGLGEKDFFATSFVRQKQVNRFVTALPSERLAIVSEWLGLDKLRAARKDAGAEFAEAKRAVEKTVVEDVAPYLERVQEILGDEVITIAEVNLLPTVARIHERLTKEGESIDGEIRDLRSRIDEERSEVERVSKLRSDAAEFDRLAEHGKGLQKQLAEAKQVSKEELEAAKKKRDELNSEWARTERELSAAKRLAAGEFSGECPVNGRSCPVSKEIAGDLKRNRTRRDELAEKVKAAKLSFDRQDGVLCALDREVAIRDRLAADLKTTADRARGLKAAHTEAKKLPEGDEAGRELRSSYEGALERRRVVASRLDRIASFLRDWKAYDTRTKEARAGAEAAKARLAIAADQVEVFARAEREIGRTTLLEIEEGANRLLATAGVDLSIRMTWGRETGTLEPTCHRCGWQYPRGQATKVCAECEAERLPKIEERLDLLPSARSDGAAEDLAGLAVQLAAAAWLRAERGIRLGFVVLDEVTASLDRSNRRAIGRVLAAMIREAGFEQGFVISHAPDVVESLPGRIEIFVRSDGRREITVR